MRHSPYQGLIPYGEQDRPYFFGRREETAIVAANLRASPLTVFYGSTGVGKSSVLRAGVVPDVNQEARSRLARSRAPGLIAVYCRDWRDDPSSSVAAAIRRTFADLGLPLAGRPPDLCRLVSEALERGNALALILDQFEEYLSYHGGSDSGAAFDRQLAEIVNARGLRANVLLSLREDALARLDHYKGRMHSVFDNYLRIEHLSVEAAREAIVCPVDVFCRAEGIPPVEVEPALVDAVAEQVQAGRLSFQEKESHSPAAGDSAGRIETPYLQIVMERIWQEEMHAASGRLRRETLSALGESAAIVRNHLDGILDAFPPEDQAIAERLFFHLVTPSGTKVAHTISDLAAFSECPPVGVKRVVERLSSQENRILRAVPALDDLKGAPRYEIYHDALSEAIRTWQRRFRAAALKRQYEDELARRAQDREAEIEREKLRSRRLTLLLCAAVVAVFAFAALALATRRATLAARQAMLTAETARNNAVRDRDLADQRLKTIEALNRGQSIRQAALTGDKQRLASLLSTLHGGTAIRFLAEAEDLKHKDPAGRRIFQFSLFPALSTMPGGQNSVALITYIADHPTFKNTLMTAAQGRGYRVSWVGWGCLNRIAAVIEYSDPTRPPTVQEFDMCALLGWQ